MYKFSYIVELVVGILDAKFEAGLTINQIQTALTIGIEDGVDLYSSYIFTGDITTLFQLSASFTINLNVEVRVVDISIFTESLLGIWLTTHPGKYYRETNVHGLSSRVQTGANQLLIK